MMNETFCEAGNVSFCNGASPVAVLVKKKMMGYDYNKDCKYDDSYAFTASPPGMCVFSYEDYEIDDKDTHTSDYIGE